MPQVLVFLDENTIDKYIEKLAEEWGKISKHDTIIRIIKEHKEFKKQQKIGLEQDGGKEK
ncbi:MAG: hypothetical protein AABY22_29790 [Nanoarchaeota archaeon]